MLLLVELVIHGSQCEVHRVLMIWNELDTVSKTSNFAEKQRMIPENPADLDPNFFVSWGNHWEFNPWAYPSNAPG